MRELEDNLFDFLLGCAPFKSLLQTRCALFGDFVGRFRRGFSLFGRALRGSCSVRLCLCLSGGGFRLCRIGFRLGLGLCICLGLGHCICLGLGLSICLGLGLSICLGLGFRICLRLGLCICLGLGVRLGFCLGIRLGLGLGIRLGLGVRLGFCLSIRLCLGFSIRLCLSRLRFFFSLTLR